MFFTRFNKFNTLVFKKSLCSYSAYFSNTPFSGKNTSVAVSAFINKCQCGRLSYYEYATTNNYQKLYYSKNVLHEVKPGFSNNTQNNGTLKISELFPQPRVTLHEFSEKKSCKVFDIIYKQQNITPKGSKKYKVIQNDWTCIYAFVWPEKMKFESSAKSKKQAAEKAATLALQWLYANRKIDEKGLPLYESNALKGIRETLNDQINVAVSDKTIERITKLMDDYQNGIRDIFENTHMKQTRSLLPSCVVKKDSTIEEENEIIDGETEDILESTDLLEQRKIIHPVYGKHITQPSEATLERRDDRLRRKFEMYYEDITSLPIDEYRNDIVTALESSRALVLVGAAGCGKSTRAPAFILDAYWSRAKILVSEPRRVAAIGLASRVAAELGEDVGETVGYQVRLHSKPPRPPGGSILYCTSGVLLRRLQLNPGLEGCSHVFIDEAHERDVNTDITLLLLKRALQLNPELKVIIMSATLDTSIFTSYFQKCSVIEVPGRTYPVSVTHLEDLPKVFENLNVSTMLKNCQQEGSKPHINYQEVVEVIKAVDAKQPEGAILVFLPGWAEIKNVKKLLDDEYGDRSTHIILPVHSRLSTTDQAKMFTKPLPGVRKIVLSTNIAETSITIPDAVYVIDTGAHKENRIIEKTGIASLETVWVSQAAAKQRTGRAGRVQPGHCYRLYTKDKEKEFIPHTTAEILRIPLEQTVLDCKAYAPDDKVEDFLAQLPEPPSEKAIMFAVNDLIDLGALSMVEQNLTALGRLLSVFTLPPRLGCALLYSSVIGNVVSMSNIVTQLSANVEVFENAAERREEIRNTKRKYSETSDHVALNSLQEEYEDILQNEGWTAVDNLCVKYGIRKERLKLISALCRLHLEQLLKSGIVKENDLNIQELNRFAGVNELNKATLLAACNSLLITKRTLKTKGKMAIVKSVFTSTGDKAHIGSESVNHSLTKRRPGAKPDILTCFGGYHCSERRAIVQYKTSLITPHTVLLFSKGHVRVEKSVDVDNSTSLVTLPRHKLKIMIPTSQVDQLMNLRDMIWSTFQYYIERDTRNSETEVDTNVSRFKIRLLKAVGRLLIEAEREYIQEKECSENESEIVDGDE